jgi:hypothetical protein
MLFYKLYPKTEMSNRPTDRGFVPLLRGTISATAFFNHSLILWVVVAFAIFGRKGFAPHREERVGEGIAGV